MKKTLKSKFLAKTVVVTVAVAVLTLFVSGAFMAGIVYNKLAKDGEKISSTPTPIETNIAPLNFCGRNTPYPMEPRFQRALSLLTERLSYSNSRNKNLMLRFYFQPILPCLDIKYCSQNEMQNADGMFFFSKQTANRNRLLICVSQNYSQEDDLLTATLIAHEATHAVQFVLDSTKTTYGTIYNNSCFGKEAMAFTEEILFSMSLTDGELQSLFSRMANVSGLNQRIGNLKDLFNIAIASSGKCTNFSDVQDSFKCFANQLSTDMENLVKNNPYYQAECAQ